MTPGTLLLGRYRVLEELGSGGYGVVLGVRDEALERDVAMKLLHRTRTQSTHDVSRFFREAEACARLTSPHVARLYHADESPELGPFMVMEWLRGADLGEVLRREGPLPVPVAITHVLEAASALAEAHALGIVHRDLKPTNLFRAVEGPHAVTKVLDFGMAKTVDDAAQLTATGALVGTPRYMAPEQLTAPKQADHRVDIWALAVVLYELVSGQSPYVIDDARGIAGFLFRTPSIPLRHVLPSAPAALEQLLARCLSPQPGDRPSQMGELAVALAPFAARDTAPLLQSALARGAPMVRASPSMAPATKAPAVQAGSIAPHAQKSRALLRPSLSALLLLVSLAALAASGALFWAARRNNPPPASNDASNDASTSDAGTSDAGSRDAGTSDAAPAILVAKDAAAAAQRSSGDASARPTPPAMPSGAPIAPPSAPPPSATAEWGTNPAQRAYEAMAAVDPSACENIPGRPRGTASVVATWSPLGTITKVEILYPYNGTPTGACLVDLYKSLRIAPFKDGGFGVRKDAWIESRKPSP